MASHDPEDPRRGPPSSTADAGGSDARDDDDEAARATQTGGRHAARARAASVSIAPGTQIGRYAIVEVLGRGAMGVVWRAHDPHLDRDVALKRVRARPGANGALARDRLLREAQALAQLSHPNVVAVHDVGLLGDDVFVAMELVPGQTLRQWLPAHRHDLRRVVAVFLEAGEGLAAAHRAGLVHRDFKPDNVIVGTDGRARVLDFGLARAADGAPPRPARADRDREASPWADEVASAPPHGAGTPFDTPSAERLTSAGTIVGTPRYMAPEQYRAATADARSDQFSFCVALYEAFFGDRPFRGDSVAELRDHVLAGDLIEPPTRTGVPARWRQAVLRGLTTNPAARFPSMDALLAELRRDPRVARRRVAVGVGAGVLAAVAVAAVAWPRHARPDCHRRDARLTALWNDAARQRLRVAFAAAHRAYAADVLARTEPRLDGFVAAWQAMRIDTCEATHVRGEQSPTLLDQRMRCLDRKLDQMTELVEVLGAAPTPDLIERAVQAVTDLGDVASCSRGAQLAGPAPRRLDAAAQARLVAVLQTIDRAELLTRTGAYADGLALARQASRDAAPLDAPATLATALRVRGGLEERAGSYAAAAATLGDALRAAAQAGDSREAALAWLDLITVLERDGNLERAAAYVQAAEVALGFVDAERRRALHPSLLTRRGLLRLKRSELDLAGRDLEEAAAATAALYGEDDHRTGTALANLGLVLMRRGAYVRAEEVLERATANYARALGPGHPLLSTPLVNLAGVLTYQRKHAAAEHIYRRALAIDVSALGPDHPYVADGKTNLGGALLAQGKAAEARPYFAEALAIQERAHGADHPDVAWALAGLSAAVVAGGHHADGRALLARALKISVAHSGADSEAVAQLREAVGASYLAEHDDAEAYRHLDDARRIFERVLGPEHPRNAIVLTELAEAAVGTDRPAEAVRAGERALALMERAEVAVADDAKAWVRFLVARARHRLGVDRPAQLAAARAARAALGTDPEGQTRRRTIDAWLRAPR